MGKRTGGIRRIGIDFGTTNSAAAMFEQNHLRETLGKGQSQAPIPSLLAYNQEQFRFGYDALEASRSPEDQSLIIARIKPQLGRSPQLRVESMSFNTEKLAARFLKFLLAQLFGHDGIPVKLEAVIGTPVDFPPSHRQALKNAATAAGIQNVDFVYEPTAAVYYALAKLDAYPSGPVAVVDWGGGTVDITIVRCGDCPARIEDLNVNARSEGLGGRDIDNAILEAALASSSDAQAWFDGSNRSIKNAILSRVERGKILYLENGELGPHVDFWHPDTPPNLYSVFRLTPELITSCVTRFVERVRRLAIETTEKADLSTEDVDHVLLVGGPCQSPIVRQTLRNIWPHATELAVEHRQRATVRGCTMLADKGFDLALGADIAVRQFDDRLHRVLQRGQPFNRNEGVVRYREFRYRVTDLSAPQAVLEIGFVGQRGNYEPIEIVSVPVMHRRDPDRRTAIPYDVVLQVGLDEILYVSARTIGRIEVGSNGKWQDVSETVELSRVPLILLHRETDDE